MFCLPFLGPLHDTSGLKEDRMHFWIDKRSGLNGRRVPASISAGRKRRRNKSMITPVHRFQSMENRNGHSSRRLPTNQSSITDTQQYSTPTISYNTSRQPQADIDTRLDLDNNAELSPPQRGNTSSIKYWVVAIFSFVVVFVTVSKYYIETQGNKIDISVASSLTLLAAVMMVCVLFGYTRYKGPTQEYTSRESVDIINPFATFGALEVPPRNDAMTLNYMLMDLNLPTSPPNPPAPQIQAIVQPEQPPPPYHLAVLLPPREPVTTEEAPPPTYEKAVVR